MQLKAHMAQWSGLYRANSLAALEECLEAPVARAEIDVVADRRAGFLIAHDRPNRWSPRPPRLDDALTLIAAADGSTIVELDLKDIRPLPADRLEELVATIAPVRERVVLNGVGDDNLRRASALDSELPIGLDPALLVREGVAPQRLAAEMARRLPQAGEAHVRLTVFEQLLASGVDDPVGPFHDHGMLLDVWTLDAGSPGWRERLARAADAGVDIVTSNTPQQLAASGA